MASWCRDQGVGIILSVGICWRLLVRGYERARKLVAKSSLSLYFSPPLLPVFLFQSLYLSPPHPPSCLSIAVSLSLSCPPLLSSFYPKRDAAPR